MTYRLFVVGVNGTLPIVCASVFRALCGFSRLDFTGEIKVN